MKISKTGRQCAYNLYFRSVHMETNLHRVTYEILLTTKLLAKFKMQYTWSGKHDTMSFKGATTNN